MPKGYLRGDPAADEMFDLSKNAYESCLALLPDDSLWHYGYAELLWSHYYWDLYLVSEPDTEGILPATLTHLQTALALDPNNQLAKDLLLEIYLAVPDTLALNGDSYTFLGLTATPAPPTPWVVEATPTVASAAATPTATFTTGVIPPNTPEPTASNPLCGGAFLLPALFGMIVTHKKRK